MKLIDITGKTILQTNTAHNTYIINTEAFERGIYFISLYDNDLLVDSKKLILQ